MFLGATHRQKPLWNHPLRVVFVTQKEPSVTIGASRSALECAHCFPKKSEVAGRINAKKDHQAITQNKIGYKSNAKGDPTPFGENDKRFLFLKIPHPSPDIQSEQCDAHNNDKGVVIPCRYKIKAKKCCKSSRTTAERTVDEEAVHNASTKYAANP